MLFLALWAALLGILAGIFTLTGASVAITGLIVLGWLGAGLLVGLLMARSR